MGRTLGIAAALAAVVTCTGACGDRVAASRTYQSVSTSTTTYRDGNDPGVVITVGTLAGSLVDKRQHPIANTFFQSKCLNVFTERNTLIQPYLCLVVLRLQSRVFVASGYLQPGKEQAPPLAGTLSGVGIPFALTLNSKPVAGNQPAGGRYLVDISLKAP